MSIIRSRGRTVRGRVWRGSGTIRWIATLRLSHFRTHALTHFPVIIRSLFFATYRDMAGHDELAVELPQGARVADLVGSLRARGGGLARLPESPVVAINMDYAPLAAELRDGDEVAFIPPVAGG
jgi:molybdopterin converting factor subunit 1